MFSFSPRSFNRSIASWAALAAPATPLPADLLLSSAKWVMSHVNESYRVWMSHVTYEWVMSHMNESCLQQPTCFCLLLPLQYVCIHMSHGAYICDVNHSYVAWLVYAWHHSLTCCTCDPAGYRDIWMSHVISVDEFCHVCEWVMSYLWMSSVTCVNESCHICGWVLSRAWMSHVRFVDELCHVCEWVVSHMWMTRLRAARATLLAAD